MNIHSFHHCASFFHDYDVEYLHLALLPTCVAGSSFNKESTSVTIDTFGACWAQHTSEVVPDAKIGAKDDSKN